LKEISYAYQGWICNTVLQIKVTSVLKYNLFQWWKNWITSIFSVTWSFRNHSFIL